MGLLDDIGAALDRPWAAAGATPEQISASPWARRGMVVSALGSQMIPAWEQGHKGFYPQLQVAAEVARDRQWQEQQRAYAVQQAEAAARQQAALERLFAGGEGQPMPTPQQALADPRMGPAGPTVQRAAAAAPPEQVSPQKLKAEQYRRAAYMVSARSPETAQKYMDLADKLDPRDEFFAPTETSEGLAQFSKQGAYRPLNVKGKPEPLPGDVRALEYVSGKPLAGTGMAGLDALSAYRKSGATNVTATAENKGNMAFAEQLAKDRAQALAEAWPQAQQAARIVGGLNTVINLAEKGTFSGPLAPGAIGAAQFMQSIGVPVAPETLTSSRLTQAVINDLILQTVAANGGARGFTAAEMPLIYDALPKLADDPQSRTALARLLQRKNRERIQGYNALREQSKNLPLFETFGTPAVEVPNTIPEGRPSLSDIFKK